MTAHTLPQPDVLICGAGIIGLALAMELRARGASVTVVDPHIPLRQASKAAAGMLAVHDPHNPGEMLPLAELSARLYPGFLRKIEESSGLAARFQTELTLQYLVDGQIKRLAEHSIDPRQLGAALLAAVRASGVRVADGVGDIDVADTAEGPRVRTAEGEEMRPKNVVHTSGAWFTGRGTVKPSVKPSKGQMLRVQLPAASQLREVYRSDRVYVVPRTYGPQAGSALIGATVEDAGFDIAVHAEDLSGLRRLAAELIPALADAQMFPQVEAWAGLRPATADGLPLLGELAERSSQWVATGHFRNGILLAPATAVVMADLLEGTAPSVDRTAFSPQRFATGD